RTSISAPERLGRARRPVIDVLTRLVADAMRAGQLAEGDPEQAATTILIAYIGYMTHCHLGNSIGSPLPTNEQFVRFCIHGLGAPLPVGWEEQFRLTDAEAARIGEESQQAAGTRRRPRKDRAANG